MRCRRPQAAAGCGPPPFNWAGAGVPACASGSGRPEPAAAGMRG